MDAGYSESGVPIKAPLADGGCDCAAVVLEYLTFARESSSRCLSFSPLLSPATDCAHHTVQEKKRARLSTVHPQLASRREFPRETS